MLEALGLMALVIVYPLGLTVLALPPALLYGWVQTRKEKS